MFKFIKFVVSAFVLLILLVVSINLSCGLLSARDTFTNILGAGVMFLVPIIILFYYNFIVGFLNKGGK